MDNQFWKKINNSLNRVKLTDKLFFTKNLNLMVRSGIGLSEAMDSLVLQTDNPKFALVLTNIADRIREGESFSNALAEHKTVFPEIFINMVKAGEESGRLEQVLITLTEQMHKEHDLKSKVTGALAYPIVVLVAMLSITIGLIVFVIPQLTDMFVQAGMQLPLPTRILIAVSNFLIHYFYVAIILVAVLVVSFIKFKKKSSGKKIFHAILLKTPVIGKLAVKLNMARLARTLSSLLQTDIPVVRAFLITSKVLDNIYYSSALKEVSDDLQTGSGIYQALNKHKKIFPPAILQMVSVGENTGTLDEILGEVAKFYEEDLDNNLKNLPSLLEPFLILILGTVVGGVAIAIMMPIYSLSQAAG